LVRRIPESGEYDSGLVEQRWYLVYGMMVLNGKVFYLIHQARDILHPVLMPSVCFGTPVGSFPSMFHFWIDDYDGCRRVVLSSKLFSECPSLYEDLLECENDDALLKAWSDFRAAVEAHEAYTAYAEPRSTII
jgi:hypothetical protein